MKQELDDWGDTEGSEDNGIDTTSVVLAVYSYGLCRIKSIIGSIWEVNEDNKDGIYIGVLDKYKQEHIEYLGGVEDELNRAEGVLVEEPAPENPAQTVRQGSQTPYQSYQVVVLGQRFTILFVVEGYKCSERNWSQYHHK